MEERNTIFTAKPGSFAKSIRAYMEYKKTWRMRMEEKPRSDGFAIRSHQSISICNAKKDMKSETE